MREPLPGPISPFLRSTCCDAYVFYFRDEEIGRTYAGCTSCEHPIDYSDDGMKQILDRMADQEFIITQPIYNIQDPLYPRGTLAERRAYWATEMYSYFLHERLKGDLRNPKRFMDLESN